MRERAGARRGLEIHDRTRPPGGDGVRARNDQSFDHAAHFHFKREANDRLSDIARACRIDRHRGVGGLLLTTEIIQLMPRPGHDSEQTDFPVIAFRAAVPAIATDQHARPDGLDPEPHILNNEDRTSSNE
jgi:hypothetical protein